MGSRVLPVDIPASHRVRSIPRCLSSPSGPQGLETALTSSVLQPGASPFPAGRAVLSQEHQDHPWCHLVSVHQAGLLSWDFSPSNPPPAMADLLQAFLGKYPVGNSPADPSEDWEWSHAQGVLPVTVSSSYFRKGDGNKWKDKVPLV